jgi:uncharacterized OB-fold protein
MADVAVAGRGHNAPCSNKDFDFFYEGLEAGRVLVQKCGGCGVLRNPPSPACAQCRSLAWDAVPLSGDGVVHSYTVHHHPPIPGFTTPHPVVLAEMVEGVRLLGAMDGTPANEVRIGMPLRFEFLRRGDVAAFRFRPA